MIFFNRDKLKLLSLSPAFVLILALTGGAALAGEDSGFFHEGPLTQADLDGYIYLTPRLVGAAAKDPDAAARLLAEAGLSRRRAVYVGAKVAIVQAMATGALSPAQLVEENVPIYLRPSPEELSLVTKNLTSLRQAQQMARQAAAGQ